MSSPRQYSAAEFSIAYVHDYLDSREPWWNSNLQKATAKIKDKPSQRRQACEELINDINSAKTAAEKIRLVAKLGRTSRQTQKEKTDKSTLFSFVTTVATYLHIADSDPLFAKTLHAIRTSIIREVKSNSRKDYLEEIAERRKKVKDAEDNMLTDIKNKVSTSDARSCRDLAFNELLDLQDEQSIAFAHIHSQFPGPLPPDDWRPFRLPDGVSVHPEIPLVYDNNYDTIYYWNEIHPNEERHKKFMGFLSRAANPEPKAAAKTGNPLLSLLASSDLHRNGGGSTAVSPSIAKSDEPAAEQRRSPREQDVIAAVDAVDEPIHEQEEFAEPASQNPQRAFFDNDAAWAARHAVQPEHPAEGEDEKLAPSLSSS